MAQFDGLSRDEQKDLIREVLRELKDETRPASVEMTLTVGKVKIVAKEYAQTTAEAGRLCHATLEERARALGIDINQL